MVLLPLIYLAYLWADLPDSVPLHWNIEGEVDRYGNKSELILIPFLLPILTYVIFLVAPYIDPKNKLKSKDSKFNKLKTLMIVFMSILAIYILNASKNESLSSPNSIVMLIGVLYIALGNYFKTIKPNYFIGIRTPWTLENENIWRKTHKMAGKMWFIGGLIVVLNSFTLEEQINLYVFLAVTGIISIIPMIYSYIKYKELKTG